MHRSEEAEYVVCASCGVELRAAERVCAVDGIALCYECALTRGGAYDERHDHWTRTPDVSDLSDAVEAP